MIKVLIASHLNTEDRVKTLEYAINSVLNNTVKPDHIYVSYSGLEYEKHTDEPLVTIIRQLVQLQQFEHYKFLTKYVDSNDIICFLDDDDLYTNDKIAVVKKEMTDDVKVLKHKFYKFGYFSSFKDEPISSINEIHCRTETAGGDEYWTLCIRGQLFKDWFISRNFGLTFDEIIAKYGGLTDLVFVQSFPVYKEISDTLVYIRKQSIKRCYNAHPLDSAK